MGLDFSTDLKNTLLADFGEPVTIDGADLVGRLIAPFDQVDIGEGYINTTAPQLHIASADAAAVSEGSVVVAGGKNYSVIGPPVVTGVGLTVLNLTEAP